MLSVVAKATMLTRAYLLEHYPEHAASLDAVVRRLLEFDKGRTSDEGSSKDTCLISYDELQIELAGINEKTEGRKKRGVYYTPADVVDFIGTFVSKVLYNEPSNDILDSALSDKAIEDFCLHKSVFDPTCGVGEFLVGLLEKKLSLWEQSGRSLSVETIRVIAGTIHGNDSDPVSVAVAKLRLFLVLIERLGADVAIQVSDCLDSAFTTYDFVDLPNEYEQKFDVVVGNPPYVEDNIYGPHHERYGNVYCNVLMNACRCLNDGGAIGFIVPLSYISTPRMHEIRQSLQTVLPCQYILSYADRPDSLFARVHQKLCILIACSGAQILTYTSNYQYWYKEERSALFRNVSLVKNCYQDRDRIPKLGTEIDLAIFERVVDASRNRSLYSISRNGNESVFLNRRETFWIKAFREPHIHPEFKVFSFETAGEADYCYCLVNSSLFWWYWISVSDCWHVSRRLNGFMCPEETSFERASQLAHDLIAKLEETKAYVGTRQTDYEYKHVLCLDEIGRIDDYVNELYGLSPDESEYIKGFALRYRTSQGANPV